MRKIESNKAPEALGPYSQGIVTGNLLFLSGQLGIDRQTGQLAPSLEGQAQQIFRNIQYVLEEEGLNLSHIVKVMVYLTDMADFDLVNQIYADQFSEPYPARSAVAVSALPAGAKIEIEVIAEKAE